MCHPLRQRAAFDRIWVCIRTLSILSTPYTHSSQCALSIAMSVRKILKHCCQYSTSHILRENITSKDGNKIYLSISCNSLKSERPLCMSSRQYISSSLEKLRHSWYKKNKRLLQCIYHVPSVMLVWAGWFWKGCLLSPHCTSREREKERRIY